MLACRHGHQLRPTQGPRRARREDQGLRRRQGHPLREGPALDGAWSDRRAPGRAECARQGRRRVRAACPEGIWRPGPEPDRACAGLRGGGLFDPRTDRDPLRLAGRRQHPSARRRGAARPARAFPEAAGRGQGALVLLHDRAGRRRLRPVAAQDHGAAGRQRMGDQRHQVADHRRRQGRLGDHHGQDGRRTDGRPRHALPRRPAQPGDQDRTHARHDRFRASPAAMP